MNAEPKCAIEHDACYKLSSSKAHEINISKKSHNTWQKMIYNWFQKHLTNYIFETFQIAQM